MPNNSLKTLSPRKLSVIAAIFLAICVTLLALTLQASWRDALIVLVVTSILSYGVYYYVLQFFIEKKLKLIYKLIYTTKAGQKENFFYQNILPQKSIEEVEQDVVSWASKTSKEMEQLKVNEQFRKEFLTNLSHELRTPIFTTQGYVHTLLDGAIDDKNVNIKFLNNASKGLDRLAQLAQDLSEISALESGNNPIVFSQFKIYELVKDIYEELMLKAAQKHIQLIFKPDIEEHQVVWADKEKIKQVLVNLIENAIKYGKENGTITTGYWLLDNDKIYIEVSDNGMGIDEQHLSRIFERFYRTEKSRSSNIAGTGLGLAIVKHIIEAHGEIVNVRSKVGVGSSFGFSLKTKNI